MTPHRTDEETITIEDFAGRFPKTATPKKWQWTAWHYGTTYAICGLVVLVFLWLLVTGQEIPEFLIGIAGSIIGFLIAKAPYDLK